MPRGDNNRKLTDAQRDEVVSLYTTPLPDGTWMGVPSIARRFGVRNFTIQTLLRKRGVQTRDARASHAGGKRCRPIKNLPTGAPPDCRCGCGLPVEWFRRENRWYVYVIGHYTQRGEQGPTWIDGASYKGYPPDWPEIATSIRRRDGWACQDCAVVVAKRSGRLHVHHIDRDTLNSASSNLVSLCASCHMKRHQKAGHLHSGMAA